MGDVLTVTAVLTAADRMTATATFPFRDWLRPITGTVTGGELTLEGPINWQGQVAPQALVTVHWSGTAMAPISQTLEAWV